VPPLRHAGIRHAANTTRLLSDLAAITEYAARNRCKLIWPAIRNSSPRLKAAAP
jgi:hypothetical protein